MAKPKKPRNKKHRPRVQLVNPALQLLNDATPLAKIRDASAVIGSRNYLALANIQAGRAAFEDIDMLSGALNMTQALLEITELGYQFEAEIQAAMQAVRDLYHRAPSGGPYQCTEAEDALLKQALAIHDAQLEHEDVTCKVIERGIKEIRSRQGRANDGDIALVRRASTKEAA